MMVGIDKDVGTLITSKSESKDTVKEKPEKKDPVGNKKRNKN